MTDGIGEGLSAGWHVREFWSRFLRHTKGEFAGSAVIAEPWQVVLTDEMFRLRPDLVRSYHNVDVGIPRKNSKSTMCAGIALYLLAADGEQGPEVYCAAGSREQARIVFGQAKEFAEDSSALMRVLDPMEYKIALRGKSGFLRAIAADGKMNHGLNPSGVILDEKHALVTPRQVANYEAMVTAQGARAQPLHVSITTAGDDPKSLLGLSHARFLADPRLERPGRDRERLKAGLTVLRDLEAGRLTMWWGADADADIEDPAVWMAANPASWITEDYLRRQWLSPDIDETSFRKLHLNQFTKSSAAWLRYGLWDGMYGEEPLPAEVCCGVDIGISGDSTAVALAGIAPDGRRVVRCRVWSAVSDVPYHVFCEGGAVQLADIEAYILGLRAAGVVVNHVRYDPRFFEGEAQRLSRRGMVVAPLHQSSPPMADAYQEFFSSANQGLIVHDGDRVLSAHVEAMAGTKTERGWRVSKLRASNRIDGGVAVVMAVYGASRFVSKGFVL